MDNAILDFIQFKRRVNPFCVISKNTYNEHSLRDIQTNSAWEINPYGDKYAVVPDDMVQDIIKTKGYCDIELNEGMIVENIVAQMIRTAGYRLYFFSDADRTSAKDRMEIDFLLAKSRTERRRNISPIEVKSGKRYSTVSLNKFRTKFKRFLDTPYVLHPKDLKIEDDVTYLPLYMTPLLVTGR